ncbi:MAG: VWA domain-containing protein [Paracoccaceae bacterium]|nr:VWA domain-containing protein [Paracoccaceae bacterium]
MRFPFFRRIISAADAIAGPGAIVIRRTRLQMIAAVLIWVLMVIALARPERLGAPIEITKSARDVVLAIDISGSMDAVDFATPDGAAVQRLEGVKTVVDDFLAAREGDRVALIVFGSQAFLQAPLTESLSTISALLTQTEVGMAGPQTAIGDAIGLAIRTFEASEIEQRLLILLSDGADTGSRMSPVNAAEIARSKGVEIHTIGVGDPEAEGENRVDTRALQDIASRTGGRSFFATDLEGLSETYAQIDEMTPRLVEQLSYRPRTQLTHYVLGMAVILGVLTLSFLTYTKTHRVRV